MKSHYNDDFNLDSQSGLIIKQLCQTSCNKDYKRLTKFPKFTVKLPLVEQEKLTFRPLTANFQQQTRSLSRIKPRIPVLLTPNLIEITVSEESHSRVLRCNSIKKIKSRNRRSSKERYSIEAPISPTLTNKLSNIMIPLPHTEQRILENKRMSSRLRIFRKNTVRIDKENCN